MYAYVLVSTLKFSQMIHKKIIKIYGSKWDQANRDRDGNMYQLFYHVFLQLYIFVPLLNLQNS